MRAVQIEEFGGPDVLKLVDVPDPEPSDGEVLIKVEAAGMNFADTHQRENSYLAKYELPLILGGEVAGTTEDGERVVALIPSGGYAEYAVAPEATTFPLPDGVDPGEALALLIQGLTAWHLYRTMGRVAEGESVVVHAAAGGVGIASTQMAKLIGAEVFGTASASKHDAIRGFGVDHPIDYRTKDFVEEVRRITGDKQPLDLAMDAIGGKSFKQSFSLLRAGGRLVCFGASAVQSGERRNRARALRALAQMPRFHPVRLMSESKSVIGINMLKIWDSKGTIDEFVEPLRKWIEEDRLRPVVAEAFPFDRAAEAHRFLHEGKNVGKVVLTP